VANAQTRILPAATILTAETMDILEIRSVAVGMFTKPSELTPAIMLVQQILPARFQITTSWL
jgi:hypothetical protein